MAKKAADLLSTTSRVEIPFIVVKMGGFTFGAYTKEAKVLNNLNYTKVKIDYPNFIKSLSIKKNASGMVNTYTLNLLYAVTPQDDPNLIEKIIGKAKSDRRITFSYGDYAQPSFSYKEEEAIIENVRPSLNVNNHTITYTITAVSNSYVQTGATYAFPLRINTKPSSVIKEILFSTKYNLNDIFYGMKTLLQVNKEGFIASDDSFVTIEAQDNITVLEYIKYLVSCMRWVNDDKNAIKKSIYKIAVFDDIKSEYGGPYFKVVRYTSSTEIIDSDDFNYMNIDIGYPENNNIISFDVSDDNGYSLLVNYNGELQQNQYVYKIDNNGKIEYTHVDKVIQDGKRYQVTESDSTWWSQLTSYPITARLVIRGLLRPVTLMSYLKINVLFYGNKYIYSGIYIISGQEDNIDSSGFKTTLTLTRVGGISQ